MVRIGVHLDLVDLVMGTLIGMGLVVEVEGMYDLDLKKRMEDGVHLRRVYLFLDKGGRIRRLLRVVVGWLGRRMLRGGCRFRVLDLDLDLGMHTDMGKDMDMDM